jgi:hypothetical protein
MRIGIIDETNRCINVIEAISLIIAKNILPNDKLVNAEDINYGIGDYYISNKWIKANTIATPSEQREIIYETEKLIGWKNKMITISEASDIVKYYFSEGDTKTVEELQLLIVPIKTRIRAENPDEV